MIKTCDVVRDEAEDGTVGINTTVELYFEEDDEVDTFSIVTTVLADSMMNRVSIESPIGRALKGHKTGDRVRIQANPDYGYYVVIRSVVPFSDEGLTINKY